MIREKFRIPLAGRLALLAGLCTAALGASAASFTSEAAAVQEKAGSGFLGKVAVATPVDVIERSGDFALVKISGWTLAEFPSQIFAKPGVRIEYASFDEESAIRLDQASETSVAGNAWVRAEATGWIPAKDLTEDLEGRWKAGAARLQDACSSSLGAPEPAHFTANQWASQLPEKGGRTGHSRAKGNALMFKYIQAHAKP